MLMLMVMAWLTEFERGKLRADLKVSLSVKLKGSMLDDLKVLLMDIVWESSTEPKMD